MKQPMRFAALVFFVMAGIVAPLVRGAEAEQGFISVLQSDKPAAEKAAACRSLKNVGTAQSVPALAVLLLRLCRL